MSAVKMEIRPNQLKNDTLGRPCLPPRGTQMFGRSDPNDTKRPFVFYVEKGRAATPASFSHCNIFTMC
jgi:hypothetical protein